MAMRNSIEEITETTPNLSGIRFAVFGLGDTIYGDDTLGTDTLGGVENITGGSGSDIIRGNAAANVLNGAVGNDTLVGRGGSDVLTGGSGSDRFIFANWMRCSIARSVR